MCYHPKTIKNLLCFILFSSVWIQIFKHDLIFLYHSLVANTNLEVMLLKSIFLVSLVCYSQQDEEVGPGKFPSFVSFYK